MTKMTWDEKMTNPTYIVYLVVEIQFEMNFKLSGC